MVSYKALNTLYEKEKPVVSITLLGSLTEVNPLQLENA